MITSRFLEVLDQAQLSHRGPAKVRLAYRPVRAVAGTGVNVQCALVLLVGIEEGLAAARGAKGIIGRSEKDPPDATTRRRRVDEEQVHLAVLGMRGGKANYPTTFVSGDQQHVGWRVVGNILIPVGRREHWLACQLSEVRPAHPDRRIKDGSDRLGVARYGLP